MTRKLGRGLDSLIEETGGEGPASPTEVDIDTIRPNPQQPREEIREGELAELTASIQEHGLLQPVLVRPADGGYELVAGERRWRAARRAGMAKIPVTVREIADDRMLEIALVENLQREDLNPIEKARAYRRYVESLDLTHEQAAQRLAKDRSTITNQLRLLELAEELQIMVSRGTLTMGHARALLGVANEELRLGLGLRIVKEGLSVRQAEKIVRELRESEPGKVRTTKREPSAHFEDLERKLRERFATKATIRGSKKRGRISLEYHSMDELTRLLELLVEG